MSRNLDTSLAAALANKNIAPVFLVKLAFKSGTSYVWSGVGDLVYGGNTYKGVGTLARISAISEGSSVRADGIRISLSGLGTSIPADNTVPAGMTVPTTPPAGTYVSWALPTQLAIQAPDSVNGSAEQDYGSLGATLGCIGPWAIGTVTPMATWSGFSLPALPSDAVITGIYAVMLATETFVLGTEDNVGVQAYGGGFAFPLPPKGNFSVQCATPSIGNSLDILNSATVWVNVSSYPFENSTLSIDVSQVALAVYYTSATNLVAYLQEALQDVQLGAAAEVQLGLMGDGALIGTPYVVFSGLIDQPDVKVSAQTVEFSLALENRLSDLARPSARRYTAADQKLFYPDDSGFDWVETLNDIALRWGG